MVKHFAQDMRNDEVQTFDELEDINTPTSIEQARFMELLNVPHNRLLSKPPKRSNSHLTYDNFLVAVNHMAKSIREQYFTDRDTLVFKSTKGQSHGGYITDTRCRPDLVAAFKSDWKPKKTTLWPCIRLVGEIASKDTKPEDQGKHAMSYLYYLLLARPDLYVAQGLFTSDSDIVFLFGIGGDGIQTLSVLWNSEELHRLMYAFIYRLYQPDHFVDPSYVKMVPSLKESSVTYTVRMSGINGVSADGNLIANLIPIYAGSPFGTRTHILSNPDSKLEVDGKPMAVLKDQLCRTDTRFNECDILTRVHGPERVPGVVEAVYHELIKIPGDFCQLREKHRLGLRQIGRPFTSIPTVGQMLEIVFDVLEVLRFLRFERNVLHRDISKGNILYIEDDPLSSTCTTSNVQVDQANETDGPEELPLCFIKYLLGKSDDPQQTSALLIDFNHAENLGEKRGNEHKRIEMTGTPVFIARAVELGGPVLPPRRRTIEVPAVPVVPISPRSYTASHPDRIQKFPSKEEEVLHIPEITPNIQWRHELDHDTESVFWLLFYWLVGAQPENEEKQLINATIWFGLIGRVEGRVGLLRGGTLADATHSYYEPLWPLLDEFARILDVDRNWLKSIKPSDPRSHPAYINEAFQRLILHFIVDHRDETFMCCKVSPYPRNVQMIPQYLHW